MTTARNSKVSFASGVNVVLGIWLIIAGFTLSASGTALGNDIVVGILIVIFASWRLSNRPSGRTGSWINFILGIWLLFAPWVLGYVSNSSRWNDFAVGWVVLILAAWSGSIRSRRDILVPPEEERRVA
ncbi:MAG TPA: SPW repeat protein [Candidatus Angelobacter sp.]|nr:SPW repeat protein [Candidatus Angelobacter sp.]